VIRSAEEFVRLRDSQWPEDHRRADQEEAADEVWRSIVEWHPRMRFWVARNKTVPVHILALLVHDPDHHVRLAVAEKRKLSPELQSILAADSDGRVREALANSANVTKAALELIASGERGDAKSAAQKRLKEPGRLR